MNVIAAVGALAALVLKVLVALEPPSILYVKVKLASDAEPASSVKFNCGSVVEAPLTQVAVGVSDGPVAKVGAVPPTVTAAVGASAVATQPFASTREVILYVPMTLGAGIVNVFVGSLIPEKVPGPGAVIV